MTLLVGDIVLHTGARVDLELAVINGATEAGVVLAGIFAFGVSLGIVCMSVTIAMYHRKRPAESWMAKLKYWPNSDSHDDELIIPEWTSSISLSDTAHPAFLTCLLLPRRSPIP